MNNKIRIVPFREIETLAILLKRYLFTGEEENLFFNTLSDLITGYTDNKEEIINKVKEDIINVKCDLDKDLDFYLMKDPAAISKQYVLLTYITFDAIMVHRFAHLFINYDMPIFARMLSEYAHKETGIDIHPAAEIGVPFFIDHGTGIVIGETTIIKDHVSLYQGVTLGAKSLNNAQSLRNVKRHPTIEENVIIYANATILGGHTVIGKNSVIGASTFITKSVKEGSVIKILEEVK